MADNIEFVDGLIVKAPNPKAPDFVKASISIKVADLGVWLRAKHKAGEEWVNIDVKESKNGRWYAAVSTFKPKENNPTKGRQDMRAKPTGVDEDVPFAPIRKVEASLL
jgi:hypothetical protein